MRAKPAKMPTERASPATSPSWVAKARSITHLITTGPAPTTGRDRQDRQNYLAWILPLNRPRDIPFGPISARSPQDNLYYLAMSPTGFWPRKRSPAVPGQCVEVKASSADCPELPDVELVGLERRLVERSARAVHGGAQCASGAWSKSRRRAPPPAEERPRCITSRRCTVANGAMREFGHYQTLVHLRPLPPPSPSSGRSVRSIKRYDRQCQPQAASFSSSPLMSALSSGRSEVSTR